MWGLNASDQELHALPTELARCPKGGRTFKREGARDRGREVVERKEGGKKRGKREIVSWSLIYFVLAAGINSGSKGLVHGSFLIGMETHTFLSSS